MPYTVAVQTVIETRTYIKAATRAGLNEVEMAAIVELIAAKPDAGVAIQGTAGCRKVRVAGRGKGKSGGYRLITFYSGRDMPAFLLTVFSKGDADNLTKSECNALAVLTKELIASYRR